MLMKVAGGSGNIRRGNMLYEEKASDKTRCDKIIACYKSCETEEQWRNTRKWEEKISSTLPYQYDCDMIFVKWETYGRIRGIV